MRNNLKKLIASLTSACVLAAPTISYAGGIGGLLDNIVNNGIGTDMQHSQPPGIFKSPTGNILSFGSYSFRMHNSNYPPLIHFSPPTLSMSCAGADFNSGWLSVLNFKNFEGTLSSAGKDLAWGIVMGLVYSLPGIADTFQKVNEWARYLQGLTQDSCMAGLELGKSWGSKIFQKAKLKGQGAAEGAGSKSSFEKTSLGYAWAREMKKYGQLKKFFGDIPYGPLYEAGIGKHTSNLIASLFGVVDWKAINPKTGHICTKAGTKKDPGCLTSDNIRVTYYQPLIKDLDTLINGGYLTLYQCKWAKKTITTSKGSYTIHYCQGKIKPKKSKKFHKGLRQRVADKINKIVDSMNNGTFNSQGATAYWIASIPVPGFADMLNYMAVLKKRGFTSDYNEALSGVSGLVAVLMLKSLVNTAYNDTLSTGIYLSNKGAPDMEKEETSIEDAKSKLSKYMKDKIQENYILIKTAEKTYQSLKADAEHSFYKEFGRSSQLFMYQ